MTTDKAAMFVYYWRLLAPADLPEPVAEYRFHETRKWRFDWAWPAAFVAVEVDGGQWQAHGGRHAKDTDREKLNAAAELDWRVFRYSTQMMDANPKACVQQVARALTAEYVLVR
jgi:very-short-patch-repair endonuclease